jgi:RND family efflux transporter MFP subunit
MRLLPILLVACSKPAGPPGGGPSGMRKMEFPVEVEPVVTERVEYVVTAVGSVDAFEVVDVVARVQGTIERVAFSEGDNVQAGKVLVEIEPRRYQLQVESAKARARETEAHAAEAKAALQRRTGVNQERPGLVKTEEIEGAKTRLLVAEAGVQEAKAALDLAELNLRDAYVRAPMSGTIETRAARTGQYVQVGTLLATLVRRDPLLVRFQVPEVEARRIAVGQLATFTVGDRAQGYEAKIIQVAQAAEEKSRMVRVTARVEGGSDLRSGAFVEARVPVGANEGAIVIPQTAVRPSERGFLGFVVDGSGGAGGAVAKERILELGMRTASGKVEVRSGLAAGEDLVVRGAEALRDGAKVVVRTEGQPRAESK